MESKKALIDKCSRRLASGFPKLSIARLHDPTLHERISSVNSDRSDVNSVVDDSANDGTGQHFQSIIQGNVTRAEAPETVQLLSISECMFSVDAVNGIGNDQGGQPIEADNILTTNEGDSNSEHTDATLSGVHDGMEDNDRGSSSEKNQAKLPPITSDMLDESEKTDLTLIMRAGVTHVNTTVIHSKVAIGEDMTGQLGTRNESLEDRRFLRSVHRCGGCSRTFSSLERLTGHQAECCKVHDNETVLDIGGEGDDEDIGNEYDFNDTDNDPTETSDDDDYSESDTDTDSDTAHLNDNDDDDEADQIDQIGEPEIAKIQSTIKAAHATGEGNHWKCPTCRETFQLKQTLDKHIRQEHPEQSNNFTRCTQFVPDAAIAAVTNCKRTEQIRDPVKVAYRFKCQDCSSLFFKIEALLKHRHKDSCPTPKDSLSSEGKRTTKVELLRFSGKHVLGKVKNSEESKLFATLDVPDQGVVLCPDKNCSLPFYYEEDLKCHEKLHGEFKCSFCDAVMPYASKLPEHELTHSKVIKSETEMDNKKRKRKLPICWSCKCSRCDQLFYSKMGYICHHLTEHMSLTLITNCCVICNSFHNSNRHETIRHYKSYHDIPSIAPKCVKRCAAENCNAYFLTLPQLVTHHKLRHGASLDQIKEIMMWDNDMYQCKDCDQTFTSRSSLRAHRLKYHNRSSHSPRQKTEYIECPKPSKSVKGKANKKLQDNTSGESGVNSGVKGASYYRFKCPDCCHLFLHLDILLVHRKKAHQQSAMTVTTNNEVNTPSFTINKVTVEILSFPRKVIPNSIDEAKDFKTITRIQVRDELHICPFNTCQKRAFLFSKDLEAHSRLHGEFKCNYCDVIKKYAPELAEHEIIHLNQGSQKNDKSSVRYNSPWKCFPCKLAFRRKEDGINHHLVTHMNLSSVEDKKCAICGWHTNKRTDLGNHYKHFHELSDSSVKSIHTCKIKDCGAYFVTKTGLALAIHMKKQHSNVSHSQRLICKDCGNTYKNIETLRFHRRNTHPETTNLFPCTVPKCGISCETVAELESHVFFRHSSTKMDFIACPKCKKSLNGKSTLKKHMKAHEREELGLLPVSNFVCESCGKCLKGRNELKTHHLSHSGPESWEFICDVCSKKCMTQQKLEEHMRTHSKEKNFVCQICGQKYAHRHNLRIHVNNKHGDVTEDRPTRIHKRKAATATMTGVNIKRKRKLYTDKKDSSESSTS